MTPGYPPQVSDPNALLLHVKVGEVTGWIMKSAPSTLIVRIGTATPALAIEHAQLDDLLVVLDRLMEVRNLPDLMRLTSQCAQCRLRYGHSPPPTCVRCGGRLMPLESGG